MDQNTAPESVPDTGERRRKPLCLWSLLALLAGILAIAAWIMTYAFGPGFGPLWVLLSLAAVILPCCAKHVRLGMDGSGRAAEIIALVLGGFAIYAAVFSLTRLPLIVGYLGLGLGALIYKLVT